MNRNAPPLQSTVQPSDQPSNHPTSQPTNPPASLRYSVTLRSIVAQDSARCGEGKITEARNRGRYPTEPFRSNGVSLQCTRRPQNNNCFIGNTEYTQRTAVNCAHVRLLSLSSFPLFLLPSTPPLPSARVYVRFQQEPSQNPRLHVLARFQNAGTSGWINCGSARSRRIGYGGKWLIRANL